MASQQQSPQQQSITVPAGYELALVKKEAPVPSSARTTTVAKRWALVAGGLLVAYWITAHPTGSDSVPSPAPQTAYIQPANTSTAQPTP